MSGSRRLAASRVLAAAGILASCGPEPEAGAPASRDTIALEAHASGDTTAPEATASGDTIALEAPTAGTWTTGVVEIPPGDGPVSLLVSVRAARHEGFDRVVWELDGSMPGAHVEYVDQPVRACGSGEPVPLPGDAWLEVRMSPANAHTDAGRATIAERRRATGLPVVLEIVQTCDFEAVVSWVLGVRSPEPFRLTRLDDPSRLVVDVRHPR